MPMLTALIAETYSRLVPFQLSGEVRLPLTDEEQSLFLEALKLAESKGQLNVLGVWGHSDYGYVVVGGNMVGNVYKHYLIPQGSGLTPSERGKYEAWGIRDGEIHPSNISGAVRCLDITPTISVYCLGLVMKKVGIEIPNPLPCPY